MHHHKRLRALCLLLACASAAGACAAQQADAAAAGAKRWEIVAGPFAYHWSDSEAHKHVYLLGLEKKREDASLLGLSLFRNSFGQPSAYAYYGKEWDYLLNDPHVYLKLSGGVIYGYKGQYAGKVPFNHHGFGLAAIPAIGWRFDSANAVQFGLLGTAAIIFTYNRGF